MVYPMINMAMTTGTIHAKPNCQLNIPMSNMVIAGTKIVPDKSGSWCARKEWVYDFADTSAGICVEKTERHFYDFTHSFFSEVRLYSECS